MKKLKLIALGIFLFVSSLIQAQVSVNVNIGTPPAWGPVGYSNVQYYYLPDVQAYYDIRATQFIFIKNGKWFRSRYLPGNYRNYDLYNGYKVVLNDYHGSHPYYYFNTHKAKYYKGYKGNPQKTIGKNPNYKGNSGNANYSHGNSGNSGNKQGNSNKGNGNSGNKGGNSNKGNSNKK
jgi:hypothetical protein